MVQNQGLDVYLAPFSDAARFDNIGKRYQEHAVPVNSPIFTGDSNEVWVQAMNGERFVVVVDLMEDFDAQSSKMLRIGVGIDDEETWTSRNYSELDCKTSDGANVEGRYSFQAVTRKVDGRWLRCGFTFVPLEMDEEMEMDQSEIDKGVTSHGKIVVKIQRGDRKENSSANSTPLLWDGYNNPDTQVSSKAVVKDNHVSHAIRHAVLRDSTQPMTFASSGHWSGLRGQPGDIMKFTIRYRSRDALQQLKILPKDKAHIDLTGSPPPSPRVKREHSENFIKPEDTQNDHVMQKVKQEPVDDGSFGEAGAQQSNDAPVTTSDAARISDKQRNKKRKAMQDELREVELEQKRLRLEKALAEMEEDDQ